LRLRGPFLDGKPDDYLLYLRWGSIAADGTFILFRTAKLLLADVDPDVWQAALDDGQSLVGPLGLMDAKGRAGLCTRATTSHSLVRAQQPRRHTR
jgi:hypothetical protein